MVTNIKFNSFLILSIPLLLVVGPFLSDLVVVILFLSAANLYFKNELIIKNNLKKFLYFFLIFYLVGVLSSSLSIDKFVSLKSSLPYFRYLGLVLIGYYLYNLNKNIIEKLGFVVILIFLIFFLDSILYFLFGFNFPIEKMGNNRFSSLFGDEKVLGGYVARLAPLGFIFISSIKNLKNKKNLFITYILLTSYLIFLSGERTALIIFFVQLFIIIIFFKNLRKFLLTTLFSVLFLITSIIYFLPNEKISKPFERILLHSLGQIYFNSQKFSFFSQRHEDHFNTSINIFKENLFLGGGNKSFRLLCSMDKYTVKENVERRFTEFSQHDDYISIIDVYLPSVFEDYSFVKQDVFFLYYKNNKKFHTTEVYNIFKFKDIFNKPLYVDEIKYFDRKKITDQDYLNLDNNFVKKNQNLFLYVGQINFGDGCNTHPHHTYLQIASENGIINLVIIIGFFVYIIIQLINIYIKKNEKKFYNEKVLLLSMILVQILPIIPSGNFYNNWLSIFFFLPIGFYFVLKDNF